MSENKIILDSLNNIFKEKLSDESIQIDFKTTANDILEWNSLNHVVLILAIEKHFQIKFNPVELSKMKNIEEMVIVIQKLINSKMESG